MYFCVSFKFIGSVIVKKIEENANRAVVQPSYAFSCCSPVAQFKTGGEIEIIYNVKQCEARFSYSVPVIIHLDLYLIHTAHRILSYPWFAVIPEEIAVYKLYYLRRIVIIVSMMTIQSFCFNSN